MQSVKTIKDVDEAAWGNFKSLAARNQMKMGPFFKVLIEGYESRSKTVWDELFGADKLLSDKEAKEMHRDLRKLRRESGFRI